MGRSFIQHNNFEFQVGALSGPASVVATWGKMDALREQGVRISKIKYAASWVTKTAGEGQIVIGICDQNLTAGEISETFAIDGQFEDDIPGSERMSRHVYPLFVIHPNGTDLPAQSFNGYKTFRYPWPELVEGNALQIFAHSSTDTITTGLKVAISSVIMGDWLRD